MAISRSDLRHLPLDLGDLYGKTDRRRAVDFYHRFMTVAPSGVFHNPNIKRGMVEATLSWLAKWNRETKGAISNFPPFPKPDPGAIDEPSNFELPEFDTSTRASLDRMIDFVLTPPLERRKRFATGRSFQSTYPTKNPDALAKASVTGRNSPCLCGSGKKFKVCCGKK